MADHHSPRSCVGVIGGGEGELEGRKGLARDLAAIFLIREGLVLGAPSIPGIKRGVLGEGGEVTSLC